MKKNPRPLAERYPPSEPCSCAVCLNYCRRPGWWALEEAARAIDAGYARRMMLEMSPDLRFGVLAPAFRGCEVAFATNEHSVLGCTFFTNGLCELHGTGHQPLECRFCHHTRVGLGMACHRDLERDWHSGRGKDLVAKWNQLTGFW